MRRVLLGLAASVAALTFTGAANAHDDRDHWRQHNHRHRQQRDRDWDGRSFYRGPSISFRYGNFDFGYQPRWSKRVWDTRFQRYHYWDECTNRSFYWCPIHGRFIACDARW